MWQAAAKTNQSVNSIRYLTKQKHICHSAPGVKMNRLKNVPMRHTDKTTRHAAARTVMSRHDFKSAQFRRGFVFPNKTAMFIWS